jgi:hypothetical protein
VIGGLERGFLIMVNADLADHPLGECPLANAPLADEAGADEIGTLGFDPFATRRLARLLLLASASTSFELFSLTKTANGGRC